MTVLIIYTFLLLHHRKDLGLNFPQISNSKESKAENHNPTGYQL